MIYLNNVFNLLSRPQKISSFYQVFLMFIAMFFEFTGLGLLVPIIDLLSSGDNIYIFKLASIIIQRVPDLKDQIVLSVFLLVVLNVAKMIFVTYQSWSQAKFIFGIKTYLTQKLLFRYINRSYIFHIQNNSAILIRNLTVVVGQFVDGLTSIFILITDFFLLMGALILLLYLYPILTAYTIAAIGITLFLFQLVTKKRIRNWGIIFHSNEANRLKYINQILGGIKEIKVYGKEDYFFDKFIYHDGLSARAGQYQRVSNALPRSFLEMFSILLISGMLLFMFLSGTPSAKILSAVGILTATAFRLLPSVYRISSALQNLAFLGPSIGQLYSELKEDEDVKDLIQNKIKIELNKSINLENVYFRYPTTVGDTLSDINIQIPLNSTVGLVGTTGAGKSTLVELILGLIQPISGKIKVDGILIENNIKGWQSQIGYVPQHIYLMDDTIEKNVAFGIPENQINKVQILDAIRAAQLEEFINELPEGLQTNIGERGVRLSGGQRQRIGIARALYNNPPLLILDEATSALDITTEDEVIKSIDLLKGKKTIVIIAHRLTSVKSTDYIYCLERGQIVREGLPSLVLNV